jgi:lysozyme family protein
MANFDPISQWLIYQEDSHSHPGATINLADGAGMTRFGITSKTFAMFVPATFFTTLPFVDAVKAAKELYKSQYWDKFHGDMIVSDQVAALLLSFSVNKNIPTAVKALQHVLAVTQDGMLGPNTILTLNQKSPIAVASQFRAEWENYYRTLVDVNPSLQRFLQGWLNRVDFPYPSSLVGTTYVT